MKMFNPKSNWRHHNYLQLQGQGEKFVDLLDLLIWWPMLFQLLMMISLSPTKKQYKAWKVISGKVSWMNKCNLSKRTTLGNWHNYRKARLVAKCYAQKEGIDYNEVFSPVVKHSSIRILLALVAQLNLELAQLDVKMAFLHGDLEEEIYMTQPEGYKDGGCEKWVYKLNKSLYGLKQSLRHCSQLSPKTNEEREYMAKVPYVSAVGSLMYAMVCTRPDISQAVGVLSRMKHLVSVWLDMLIPTMLVIWISVDQLLGICLLLLNPQLIEDLGVVQSHINLYCDSQSAIHLEKNQVYHSRTKHIDVKYHFVREIFEEGKILLQKITTLENPADMMTKVGDDSSSADRTMHLAYIPLIKPKLSGHEESYNPSLEYIPTQEEINSYQLTYEEDRPKFIPKRFISFRSIPAYENAVKNSFERCLDLYLCPRVRKKRLGYKISFRKRDSGRDIAVALPSEIDFHGFYGHEGAVLSISVEPSGQWIASGKNNLPINYDLWRWRLADVLEFGRLVKRFSMSHGILCQHVLFWQFQRRGIESHGGHFIIRRSLTEAALNLRLPFKLHGLPVSLAFHPTRPIFSVATKKNVRVYDMLKQKLIKKLETQLREVSSISVHPAGDNVIVGSKEGKLRWFDMDLSSKPYQNLEHYECGIPSIISSICIVLGRWHCLCVYGMVYADLNENPRIVPLEILRGHSSSDGRGVLECTFHPRQPWLFTAGADSTIKLYCH
ncbi:Transducin/WD40 repeat-like superfamily protein isoform 2 [Hibiscus syriacus]|uniref:Transducin/WD40 repeat-like superfamily protein isoform 2 n=1 Tax=Hibiscus syriacus TaxID=106335 RepID=A0A6A2ZIB5_HIBSY|nr:Transducin/WD40 repeat-like superfamily protein isoform 2 [Hibiscus syriacus]